jgi:adenine-specific DNA-methyltransferase
VSEEELPLQLAKSAPSRSARASRPSSPSADSDPTVALRWPHMDGVLVDDEGGGYRWVKASDPEATECRPLRAVETVGDPRQATRNLLIRGDAFHALRSLVKTKPFRSWSRGQVSLCYMDPPFNRGDSFGYYDDALATEMWLSMLRDRLVQMRDLLAPDGSVWLHIDDSHQHHARCLLDEVFGQEAFVATVIWQRRRSRDNRKAFSAMHDYIHVYTPGGARGWKKRRNPLPDDGAFSNPDDDPRGPWRSVPMSAPAGHGTVDQFYTVISPTGVRHDPPPGRCWTYTLPRFEELVRDGRVYWPKGGDGKPRLKRYRDEVTGLAPFTIWLADDVGENSDAKKDLLALFNDGAVFDTPKPEALMERIIHIGSNPGEVVLDCFLGSGTTAAVAHKMGRHWIGIERSPEVMQVCTLPRLRRVVDGTDGIGITPLLDWTGGGGFTVLDLGDAETRVNGDRLSA